MSTATTTSTTHLGPRGNSARAFVRNFNIMLKFARLYGFDHVRTSEQIDKTWGELQAALSGESEGDILIAGSGNQLLLNGAPLGNTGADRALAQLLTSIGIASVHFSSNITREAFDQFVRGFPSKGSATAAETYKRALEGVPGVRLNEICFVPADSAAVSLELAAQITGSVLRSTGAEDSTLWFADPERLLQLIAAAQGSRGPGGAEDGGTAEGNGSGGSGGSGGAAGTGEGNTGAAAGSSASAGAAGAAGGGKRSRGGLTNFWDEVKASMRGLTVGSGPLVTPEQEDVCKVLRLMRRLPQNNNDPEGPVDALAFQSRLAETAPATRMLFQDALMALAAQVPAGTHDKLFLHRLAEHMAIRFAVESFERGDTSVNAAQQLLERMGQEIVALRDILGAQEGKLKNAGISVDSYKDQLEQRFWTAVPPASKRTVLLSADAWSVPPRYIMDYLREQKTLGDHETCRAILSSYLKGVENKNPDARNKTFTGLCDLSEFYGEEAALLDKAITHLGACIGAEKDRSLRTLASAAFVRLSQEGAARHSYSALEITLSAVDQLKSQAPEMVESLQQRIGLEDRLSEFLEEALSERKIPKGLVEILQRLPRAGAKRLARRFGQAGFYEDCYLLLDLFEQLGPQGNDYLKLTLTEAPPLEVVEIIALLSRTNPALLQEELPRRLRECPRSFHDMVVRRIALSGGPERGSLLAALYDSLDPLIRPLALDEIGMSGDAGAIPWLLTLAEAERHENELVRLKAIEAAGRLRAKEVVPVLQRILGAKQMFRWTYPAELRIVAAQTLGKVDLAAWQILAPCVDLKPAQLSSFPALDSESNATALRQRRYLRFGLARPVTAVTTNLRENFTLELSSLNLGGGMGIVQSPCPEGTVLALKLSLGRRSASAQVLVRKNLTGDAGNVAFEIVRMSLADRSRLRQFLTEVGRQPQASSAKNRARRSPASSKR
jgi:hypothetical protein